MKVLSLQALLSKLVSVGVEKTKNAPSEETENKPTSIRLEPDVRRFIKSQAEALGASEQSVIAMILRGVVEMSTDQTTGDLRTIRERFLYLFHIHKIDLPSTAFLLKEYGFSLSALGNNDQLLDLITPEVINNIADLFHVRPQWISGATDAPIELGTEVRWYKNVFRMASKLIEYKKKGLKPHVMFIQQKGAEFDKAFLDNDSGKADEEPIGVIIRLTHEYPNEISFKTYEAWDFERWNYWRCREQIKLLICFCDQASQKHLLSYGGYSLSSNAIRTLTSQMGLPIIVAKEIHQVTWHPEDYASIRFKIEHEKNEWETIATEYRKNKLDSLLEEGS